VRLTAQEEYGLRCLLQVAREDGSLTTPQLAEREGLTPAYVHKLMRMLRGGGLVKSVRGRKGGYQLARPADQITLGAALVSLGGSLYSKEFCGQHKGTARVCVRHEDCSIRAVWMAIDHAVQRALGKTRLSDLLRTEPEMTAWIETQPATFPLRTLS
jgi:Rrf2 family iron-sulfur cluster assembly transcriptional regulator